MPYFFAHMLKNKKDIAIIWTKDGAIVSPITALVKKCCSDRLEKVINFLTSEKLANICSNAFFPTVHPKAENKLPEVSSLNWIGWDFIKESDIGEQIKLLNTVFMKAFYDG